MKIKKKAYADLGECIVSDQVPAHKVAMYFDDEDFLKWYRNQYFFPFSKNHNYFKMFLVYSLSLHHAGKVHRR